MTTLESSQAKTVQDLLSRPPVFEMSLVKYGSESTDMVAPARAAAPAQQPDIGTEAASTASSPIPQKKIPKETTIAAKDLGLKVLYEPKDVDETKLDIIAVHGIGVNPTDTWVHRDTGSNWLGREDMLPKNIPLGRIMTFSYDSVWFGKNAGKHTVDQVATKLLRSLQRDRSTCPRRPMIFIAHCFGGLVIQKAFTLALSNIHDFPDVAKQMRGMVFLATPHHGLASSTLSTQEKIYKAIEQAGMHFEKKAFDTVTQDNETLTNVVFDFTRSVSTMTPSPQLFCFFETKATKFGDIGGLNIAPEFVINEASGTLSGHQKESLPLNHFMMNKFEGPEDDNYKSVMTQIVSMAARIETMEGGDLDVPKSAKKMSRRNHIATFLAPLTRERNFAERGNILETLDKAFRGNERVVLCGESGFGKTHIAVEYAHKFHADHSGASIYWINANTAEQFELSFKLIEESMHPYSSEHVGHESLLKMVQGHLKRASKTALLIVLDGLEDESCMTASHDPKLSLLDLLPKSETTQILMTTRSKALARRWTKSTPHAVVNVGKLTPEDASFIIYERITSDEIRMKFVKTIGSALGYSGGELSMVLHYKDKVGKRFETRKYMEIAGILPKSKDTIERSRPKDGPSPSWLPLQHLMKANQHDLMDLTHVLCVMNVQCIPNSFFTKQQLDSQVKSLTEYGIIEPSPTRRVFTISAMVRRSVRACLAENSEIHERKAAEEEATRVICENFSGDKCLELLPCALEALKFKPESPAHARCSAQLHAKVSAYYKEMKRFSRAKELLEAAMKLHEANPKSDQRNDDMTETKRSIGVLRQLIKGDGSGRSKAQTTIASTTTASQEIMDVLPIHKVYERAVERHRRGSQVDLDDDTLVNDYREVSEWHKQHHGEDNITTVLHQFNLAMAYAASGQYQEAEKLYMSTFQILKARALSMRDMQEVEKHELRARSNLAGMYCEQGRYDDAGKAFEAVLPLQKELLGEHHPDTLWTRHNFACLDQERGDFVGARKKLRSVAEAQWRRDGLNPAFLTTSRSIALNSRLQGRLGEAESHLKAILSLQSASLGDDNLDTMKTRRMLEEVREETNTVA